MSKQGTAGKRKHVTLTVPQKLIILRGLKVAQAEVWLWLHTMLGSQLCYKETEGLIMIIYGSVKGLFNQHAQ